MNSINEDLQFTMEIGKECLSFSDLRISIVNNKLETTVYSKPTNSHLYLHAKSCHQPSTVNGIQKGVALRLRRICSSDGDFHQNATEYTSYLTARGHSHKSVENSFKKMFSIPRNVARQKVISKNDSKRVVFATKFNPRGPDVKKILENNLNIIANNPILNNIFPKGSILVASKRENNLGDLILRGDPYSIKSDLIDTVSHGFTRCSQKCDSCDNFVDETTFVNSHATGRKFRLLRDSTCSTRNVIYVAYCTKCGKQGVG